MPEPAVAAVEQQPNVVIIRALVESFDEENVRRFQGEVRAAADTNAGLPVVLDLAKVNFMPSMSLAALVRLVTEFRSRKQRLVLAGLQPQVREIFMLTRLDRLFELQDDVAAAVRAADFG